MNDEQVHAIAPPLEEHALTITTAKTSVIVKANGTVEYGEGYTPDETARAFWGAMAYHFPGRVPAITADKDALDAARYRWVRAKRRFHIQTETNDVIFTNSFENADDFDAALDEARTADKLGGANAR